MTNMPLDVEMGTRVMLGYVLHHFSCTFVAHIFFAVKFWGIN